jgi:hypothetical protein
MIISDVLRTKGYAVVRDTAHGQYRTSGPKAG